MIICKKKEIKLAIFKKGLTQNEFSKKIGISPNMMSLIINGKRTPSPGTAKKIVNELNLGFDEIFMNLEDETTKERGELNGTKNRSVGTIRTSQ
ncbi:helix-turn-helix transcriptional regulator [Carnobacterium divergens]|uniref:helix-turn-helix transcriptional regulator n=1 Tax=Carnobacterium divergens TaxID=2748 RepID=UPI0039AE987B